MAYAMLQPGGMIFGEGETVEACRADAATFFQELHSPKDAEAMAAAVPVVDSLAGVASADLVIVWLT